MVNHAAPRQNGHSMVFDNDGTILKELGEEEGILLHTFDFDRLNAARANGNGHSLRSQLEKLT